MTITKEDAEALDKFRQVVLDLCEEAGVELIDSLSDVYPNMDINNFLDLIDDSIDEFTYDAMNDNNEDETEE